MAQVCVSGEKKRLCVAREHTGSWVPGPGCRVPAGRGLQGGWSHRVWKGRKPVSWAWLHSLGFTFVCICFTQYVLLIW